MPGATPDHVQVTNGGSEANYITAWQLVEPGDDVVLMTPNYMQLSGLARAFGAAVREWPLVDAGRRWTRGPRRARAAGDAAHETDRRSAIRTIRPARASTPTISIVSRRLPRATTAWILSDEIYRGAELDGRETPSIWGRSDRAIVTSGLSKAYGLPGLRIGWVIAPPSLVASLWAYHDYTSIAPGALSDALARHALEPERRARILARTRGILNDNFPIAAAWLDAHGGAVQVRAARCRRDCLRAVPASDQFHRARYAPARATRACCSCRAITSAWITICVSDSATRPSICTARSHASTKALRTFRADPRRPRQRRAPVRVAPRGTADAPREGAVGIASGARRRRQDAALEPISRPPTSSATPARGMPSRRPTDASSSSRRRRSTCERGEPATSHVRTALAGGAHVITANKGPVAFAYAG